MSLIYLSNDIVLKEDVWRASICYNLKAPTCLQKLQLQYLVGCFYGGVLLSCVYQGFLPVSPSVWGDMSALQRARQQCTDVCVWDLSDWGGVEFWMSWMVITAHPFRKRWSLGGWARGSCQECQQLLLIIFEENYSNSLVNYDHIQPIWS